MLFSTGPFRGRRGRPGLSLLWRRGLRGRGLRRHLPGAEPEPGPAGAGAGPQHRGLRKSFGRGPAKGSSSRSGGAFRPAGRAGGRGLRPGGKGTGSPHERGRPPVCHSSASQRASCRRLFPPGGRFDCPASAQSGVPAWRCGQLPLAGGKAAGRRGPQSGVCHGEAAEAPPLPGPGDPPGSGGGRAGAGGPSGLYGR